jgi:hypothetical protein
MLERRFVRAEIKQRTPQCFKLTITYSFYSLYDFSEVFVYKSLQEAKDRLITERCHANLTILDTQNKEVPLDIDDG